MIDSMIAAIAEDAGMATAAQDDFRRFEAFGLTPAPAPAPENTRRGDMTEPQFDRNERFERGLALRREVLGREHVERSLARAGEDPFLLPIQQIAVEFGWGEVWSRPGLSMKTRSFLSIAFLAAQGKLDELGAHVAGAVRNGATREEIGEVLLQAALYCGMPAGLEGFRVAKRALDELDVASPGGGVDSTEDAES